MRIRLPLLCLILFLLPASAFAQATVELRVHGVDDAQKAAVISAVELSQYANYPASEAVVRRLYQKAPEQAIQAMQPFGYFDAKVNGKLERDGKQWQVTLNIQPGPPVRVTALHIDLPATAMAVREVRRSVRRFHPAKGEVLDQTRYVEARDAIHAALLAAGFLDAEMTVHRVAVTRASHAAVIHLAWSAGKRYRFGKLDFEGSQLEPGFLQRYVPWQPGDFYAQQDLLTLQQRLNGADYFGMVNVEPQLEQRHDDTVDVKVQLAPAKRSIYTGGPFFGTDTGLGAQFGLERRYVNDEGHKWKTHLVLAQRLKMLSSLYTIPRAGQMESFWNIGANYREADTDTSHTQTLELVGNQTRTWHDWLVTAGLHVLSGTYTVGRRGGEPLSTPGIERGNSTLVYPEISLTKKLGDNPIFVRNGWTLTLTARSSAGKLLSDTRFSQLEVHAKRILSFARRNRLLFRVDAGITKVADFSTLPPQLRYFAGGSRSNRGYGYQALGPRNAQDRVMGGTRLLATGLTAEHYFTRHWGMAAFVDVGNAFNGTDFRPRIGAGLGMRWLSPVGMIRLDLGFPVHNDRHHGLQINIVIGPDL